MKVKLYRPKLSTRPKRSAVEILNAQFPDDVLYCVDFSLRHDYTGQHTCDLCPSFTVVTEVSEQGSYRQTYRFLVGKKSGLLCELTMCRGCIRDLFLKKLTTEQLKQLGVFGPSRFHQDIINEAMVVLERRMDELANNDVQAC